MGCRKGYGSTQYIHRDIFLSWTWLKSLIQWCYIITVELIIFRGDTIFVKSSKGPWNVIFMVLISWRLQNPCSDDLWRLWGMWNMVKSLAWYACSDEVKIKSWELLGVAVHQYVPIISSGLYILFPSCSLHSGLVFSGLCWSLHLWWSLLVSGGHYTGLQWSLLVSTSFQWSLLVSIGYQWSLKSPVVSTYTGLQWSL